MPPGARADEEKTRADREQARAEALAHRLRELGIKIDRAVGVVVRTTAALGHDAERNAGRDHVSARRSLHAAHERHDPRKSRHQPRAESYSHIRISMASSLREARVQRCSILRYGALPCRGSCSIAHDRNDTRLGPILTRQ